MDCDSWVYTEAPLDTIEQCAEKCESNRSLCDYFSFFGTNVRGHDTQAFCYLYLSRECQHTTSEGFEGALLYKMKDLDLAPEKPEKIHLRGEDIPLPGGLPGGVPGLPGLTDKTEEFCPSSDCWFYDEDIKGCTMKPNVCLQISCGAKSILMEFSKTLFAIENGEDIVPAIKPDYTGDKDFAVECELGTCGMIPIVENDQ